jgi:hypothetical protein
MFDLLPTCPVGPATWSASRVIWKIAAQDERRMAVTVDELGEPADGKAVSSNQSIDLVPRLIQRLYALTRELEEHFPGRPFTPDGHLVGSLGEVLAAHQYGLELLPCSAECHDARADGEKLVQIKATQGSSVALRSEPQHLLVLKILRDGTTEEAYNGPGALAWAHVGPPQKNGQRSISLSKLRRLMEQVSPDDRLLSVSA